MWLYLLSLSLSHAYAHTHTPAHTPAHTHAHTRMHARTHAHACTHTHTRTHTHVHTHTHTHAHTHTGSVLQHYELELQRLKSEFAGLSGTRRQELEDMLMEGDLLEVTMDEIQQLWQLLQSDAEFLAAFERVNSGEEREGPEEEDKETGGGKEVGCLS